MLQLSFNKRVHIWKPSFSIPNLCIKHLQYTIYMCHPYRITPWLIFSKCALRLMSDTEPDKKHIIFFFFISGWITTTKSYRKPPRSLIHIGSTYFLFYSLFHFSFTGHRSENTVSHPNNSILIFPLNVSFLHGTPIKTVSYQSWHGWATWKFLSLRFIFGCYCYLGYTLFFPKELSAPCAASSLYAGFLSHSLRRPSVLTPAVVYATLAYQNKCNTQYFFCCMSLGVLCSVHVRPLCMCSTFFSGSSFTFCEFIPSQKFRISMLTATATGTPFRPNRERKTSILPTRNRI